MKVRRGTHGIARQNSGIVTGPVQLILPNPGRAQKRILGGTKHRRDGAKAKRVLDAGRRCLCPKLSGKPRSHFCLLWGGA